MPASKKEAKEFVKRWQKRLAAIPAGSNNEQQDTQKFWVDLLINVLGIPSNAIDSFVDFERKVRGRRIDVFVSDHNFLCEQKSWGIDLDKPEPRNGGMETPLQQAMWYARHLPYSERPRWVMTCNFGTFRLYDLDNERPEDTAQEFSLEELPDSLYLLSFLTSNETSRLHKEQQLSIEAGAYVSRLYDALAKQYHHIEEKDERAQEEQRSLNVLITRIIFLLYAEDADLLQSHQAFGRYCEGDPAKLRRKLVDLFETIDTPLEQRDEYMDEDLAAFPYVNGGLFADSSIIVPQMTSEILEAIADASQDFDWREISGVIFGGVFEGTLNPETRHAGGMHYTSVENIERCLRPLFLDELWDELHEAEGEQQLNDVSRLETADEFRAYFDRRLAAIMTDDYFSITLPSSLDANEATGPTWWGFVAAQVVLGAKALFSTAPLSQLLLTGSSGSKKALDKHHLFPDNYLKAKGYLSQRSNRGNFTLVDYQNNIYISDDAPNEYVRRYRAALGEDEYRRNCEEHALPVGFEDLDYEEFLGKRRQLMGELVKGAYERL